jgi:hypothetical protein
MSSTKLVIRPEDFLVNHLFEDSFCFLELAKEHEGMDPIAARRYVRASIVTAYAGLEALVNTSLAVIEDTEDLALHERAFILEKRVELARSGDFEIRGRHFTSLEGRIRFLYWRSKGKAIPKGSALWRAFHDATDLRNKLVHPRPRKVPYSSLTTAKAKACLMAAVELAEMLGGRPLILQASWDKLADLKPDDASRRG